MNCAICLIDENEIDVQKERMISKCNHFFHKQCFYQANRENDIKKCPICRTPCPEEYTIKTYSYSEIPKEYMRIFKRLVQLSHLYKNDFIVSGSFAVYMYHILYNKKVPKWKYNDIDIYTHSSINDDIYYTINNTLFISNTNNSTESVCKYYKNLTNIKSVNKLSSFSLKNITKETDFIQKIENYDIITIDSKITPLYNIVEDFDLDCCKIAIQFSQNNGIDLIIHNSFYVDSYTIRKKSIKNTMNRVLKYRERGFLVRELSSKSDDIPFIVRN